MARVYGCKKGSRAGAQYLRPFQIRGHLGGSKGQGNGEWGEGHPIQFNRYLPSTSYVEVNGISVRRDQKKEEYHVGFSLKGVNRYSVCERIK